MVKHVRQSAHPLKSVPEASESKRKPSPRMDLRPESGCFDAMAGHIQKGYAVSSSRIGKQPAPPGVEPITYRTKGCACERGMASPDAGYAKSSKRPSRAMSGPAVGVPIVVRARENRAHGEGGQSIRRRLKPQGQTVYAVSESERNWLLSKQRALYTQSWTSYGHVFTKGSARRGLTISR